jgi:anti-sigma factor ChrR (cupin superfamily)
MLNLDFSERVVINANEIDWVSSPASGVLRKPFAREEAERGHATSIVKFESGSAFDRHGHPLGEEFLVLDGVFSDEFGDYGKGSYIRNPPGSFHSPFSKEGCVLFVKLHQFSPGDLTQVRIDTNAESWSPGIGGLEVMPLHEFGQEHVALVKWPAGEEFQHHNHPGGEEILVLSGELRDEHGSYPAHTWLRSPHMSEHQPFVEKETVLWVKTGHLPVEQVP